MWEKLLKLQTSQTFADHWMMISTKIGIKGSPLFYQCVIDVVAEKIIHEHFIVVENRTSTTSDGLSYEEQYALRYASGYIIRALRNA